MIIPPYSFNLTSFQKQRKKLSTYQGEGPIYPFSLTISQKFSGPAMSRSIADLKGIMCKKAEP
jgi:hypothetical protein